MFSICKAALTSDSTKNSWTFWNNKPRFQQTPALLTCRYELASLHSRWPACTVRCMKIRYRGQDSKTQLLHEQIYTFLKEVWPYKYQWIIKNAIFLPVIWRFLPFVITFEKCNTYVIISCTVFTLKTKLGLTELSIWEGNLFENGAEFVTTLLT